ncbi:MAG TPA: alpha/beta hydrolase, partial [Flavisolibacter sp.]|nr:alpha/beta hydrolase [Flavisolibacter sp.]
MKRAVEKKLVVVILFMICCLTVHSQSTAGITGIPDTSYSIAKEYEKLRKDYPFIQIPSFSSKGITERKEIVYCSAGKRKLRLDAFFPTKKTSGKRTAVVMIHGGGWRTGNKSMHHPLAQRLADLGYVCFTPEYRLSTEALYPAAVYDLKAALRWVHANAAAYQIDT